MKLKDKLTYILLCAGAYPVSLLPLRVLYLFADITAFLAARVVRYRRKVIRQNLDTAFPDMTDSRRREIEKGFYRFLADYGVETLKLLTISRKEMRRRMTFDNIGSVNRSLESGRNVVLYLGHYCNWEWVSSMPEWLTSHCVPTQVYHHLHSKAMDLLFIRIRTRFHAHNEEMKDIMRFLIENKRAGRPTITGLIADQSPRLNHHLFADFFHRETGWFTGPERIARFLDADVFYGHMERTRRGYYRLRFDLMTDTPKKEETFSITREFISRLEQNITEAPQYYLWSHRRWKHSRREFNEFWGDKAAEQLSHL